MSTDERSVNWYNHNADEYTKHVRDPQDSIYHSMYEKPAMYALLPELQEKAVLSLGCGSGEDCEYLRQQGASEVQGIDISEGMITIAKDTYKDCEFAVMDMEQLAFEDQSFDFIYSSLAIHYIEDWGQVFSEAFRVLKPGGSFLFSCNHPVYSTMETVQDDETTKVKAFSRTVTKATGEVSIIGDYVTRKPLIINGAGTMQVTTWHKSIGEIAKEAAESGFMIANFVEPEPQPEMEAVAPKDYETLKKLPNFAIFKLHKPL